MKTTDLFGNEVEIKPDKDPNQPELTTCPKCGNTLYFHVFREAMVCKYYEQNGEGGFEDQNDDDIDTEGWIDHVECAECNETIDSDTVEDRLDK